MEELSDTRPYLFTNYSPHIKRESEKYLQIGLELKRISTRDDIETAEDLRTSHKTDNFSKKCAKLRRKAEQTNGRKMQITNDINQALNGDKCKSL